MRRSHTAVAKSAAAAYGYISHCGTAVCSSKEAYVIILFYDKVACHTIYHTVLCRNANGVEACRICVGIGLFPVIVPAYLYCCAARFIDSALYQISAVGLSCGDIRRFAQQLKE